MTARTRRLAWGTAAMVIACCATALMAQTGERPDGSMASLTAELRQLREAVEALTKVQAQTQALGVYLSAQQSRVTQTAARLDAVQKDLDTVVRRAEQVDAQLTQLNEGLPNASPSERLAIADAARAMTVEQKGLTAQLQQARAKETELLQALQLEEGRWTDLISRLEQLMAR
jgi:DNA repair exonuclease SbcCD ATPase subunit